MIPPVGDGHKGWLPFGQSVAFREKRFMSFSTSELKLDRLVCTAPLGDHIRVDVYAT